MSDIMASPGSCALCLFVFKRHWKIKFQPIGSYLYAFTYIYKRGVLFLRIELGIVEAERADHVQGYSRVQNKRRLRCPGGDPGHVINQLKLHNKPSQHNHLSLLTSLCISCIALLIWAKLDWCWPGSSSGLGWGSLVCLVLHWPWLIYNGHGWAGWHCARCLTLQKVNLDLPPWQLQGSKKEKGTAKGLWKPAFFWPR